MVRVVDDVGVVGGGYAGLAAALVLRRHRVEVRVFHGGPARNALAEEVHGYLGVPGTSAEELLGIGRRQVEELGGRIERYRIEHVERDGDSFLLRGAVGREWRVRRLLLATGVRDRFPQVEGFDDFYGRSVHVCPHCDGYEWRDRPVTVMGSDDIGDFASKISHWSRDVTVVTDAHGSPITPSDRAWLEGRGISVGTSPVESFEGHDGRLERLRLADGSAIETEATFFSLGEEHQTALAELLGCRITDEGAIAVDGDQRTSVEGVWAAGDVCGDSQFVPVATAHGVKAAVDIYRTLEPRDPESHEA